jgi:4-hydroxy-tetrahydrodipicolinate synthase
MTNRTLRGVIAATPTPVLPDFSPDAQRLLQHCALLLDGGCDGINLLGTTGEANSFSIPQRLALMRAVAQSKLPTSRFMVGTGVCSLQESVELTQAAADLGFGGALVLPPFYYPGLDAQALTTYVDHLIHLADRPRLPMYLYHIPQNTGIGWPLESIRALKKLHSGVLAGLKDSSGDIGYSRSVVQAVGDFDVFPSSEATLATARADGFAGCISATTNITAADAQLAWKLQGKPESERHAARASGQRNLLARAQLVASVKAALASRYHDEEWLRMCPPLPPRSAREAQDLGRELDAVAL